MKIEEINKIMDNCKKYILQRCTGCPSSENCREAFLELLYNDKKREEIIRKRKEPHPWGFF